MGCFILCLIVGSYLVLGLAVTAWQSQQDLATPGDRLWAAGKYADAADHYKAAYSSAGSRRAALIQRIVQADSKGHDDRGRAMGSSSLEDKLGCSTRPSGGRRR